MKVVTCVSLMMAVIIPAFATVTYAGTNSVVEDEVRQYFKDIPVMVRIADCESDFTHYDSARSDGVLKNPKSSARGVFQILTKTHKKEAEKKGLNLWELKGNMAYARHLYLTQGTRPWKASKGCWV